MAMLEKKTEPPETVVRYRCPVPGCTRCAVLEIPTVRSLSDETLMLRPPRAQALAEVLANSASKVLVVG
jgi:hypothetical protein